jgi:hypothetical protein
VANTPASTPAAADGRLFVLSSACRLRALATATGEVAIDPATGARWC